MTNEQLTLSTGLQNATGEIPFTFLNDYMFRAILQDKKNEGILKELVCSILHLKPENILSIEVTNPISFGESINDKEFILDINVFLNGNTNINLEMQVINLHNWPERSLAYLARNYDSLNKGSNYLNVSSAYHIGFLDYTLFEDAPEFFSKFQMRNIKNHKLLTSKFNLYVIDLTQIELATNQDKEDKLDYWARLFKAKTWEEIKMVTSQNPKLSTAAEELFRKNQDDIFKQQCRAREEYYAYQNYIENRLNELTDTITEKDEALAQKDEALIQKDETIAQKDEALAQKDEALIQKDETIVQKDFVIQEQSFQLEKENAENLRLRQLLKEAGINPDKK